MTDTYKAAIRDRFAPFVDFPISSSPPSHASGCSILDLAEEIYAKRNSASPPRSSIGYSSRS